MHLDRQPDDHEAAMARADLYKLANYSMKLFKMIHEGQELEGWVQAKITKAADYIASVYHFMEYEMKSSEYGDALENAEMYSESVRRAFEQKLLEAKAQAKKVKEKSDKMDEGFEDMQKWLKDKNGPQPSGGSGVKKGSRYGGSKQKADDAEKDDEDEKPTKSKKVKEAAKPDYLDFDKDGNKKEPMKKALKDKKIKEVASDSGPKGQPVQQITTSIIDPKTKKPVKMTPYDVKKSAPGGVSVGFGESSSKCNHSAKGKKCPVHGLKECGSMYESKKKIDESHDPIYKLSVVKANEKSGQLKITYWLRQETGLPKDAFVYFDDADLVYGEKTIVPDALVNPKLKMKDLVVALEKAIQEKETEGGGMYEAKNLKQQAAIAIAKKKAK